MIDTGKFKGDQHLSDAFVIGGVVSDNEAVSRASVPCSRHRGRRWQDIGLDVEEFIILMEEARPETEHDNLLRACVAEFLGLMLFQALPHSLCSAAWY